MSAILTRPQKAAVIIGVLGTEAAGSVLEQLDEACLKAFTRAMSELTRIDGTQVRATISEFLAELKPEADSVTGGLTRARGLLQNHVAEGVLARIMEEAAPPSAANVWARLAKVADAPLAEALAREHPQTTAVVLANFTAEHAARLVDLLPADTALEVVTGLTKAGNLDAKVTEAIAEAMGRDMLATLGREAQGRDPVDRAGAIMNFAAPALRDQILAGIEADDPDLAGRIRRKMFTIPDIPDRVPKNAVATVVRSIDQDTLLRALVAMRDSAPDVADYLLANISSRVAAQLKEEMGEIGGVRAKDADRAQTEMIRVIRDLAQRGEITLVEQEDEA